MKLLIERINNTPPHVWKPVFPGSVLAGFFTQMHFGTGREGSGGIVFRGFSAATGLLTLLLVRAGPEGTRVLISGDYCCHRLVL